MKLLSALIIVAALLVIRPVDGAAVEILLGGVGRGSSEGTPGSLVILDQTTAAGTFVGHPGGVAGLTGLAFDSTGALFGTAIAASFGSTSVIRIDPDTGAQIGSAVPITFGGSPITINDLSFQPGTDALFGTSASTTSPQSRLVTIDTTTGVATLVGNLPNNAPSGGIAFGPDGTLFQAFQHVLAGESGIVGLHTLDPANAAVLSETTTGIHFFGGLAARRSDGLLFGSTGRFGDEIFAIEVLTTDPLTISLTLIGNQDLGSVGDLGFRVVPDVVAAPATLTLLALGLVALRWASRRQMWPAAA